MKGRKIDRFGSYIKFSEELIDDEPLVLSMVNDSIRKARGKFQGRFFLNPMRVQFGYDADDFIRNLVTGVIKYERVRVKPRRKSVFSK